MAKRIVVLGNGFDLDLGLKTSYSDFAKSNQWSELMDNNLNSLTSSRLLGFLKSKYDVEKWIDVEAALLEFATLKTRNKDYSHASDDEEDFHSLCKALKEYLAEQQSVFNPTNNSVAYVLLRYFGSLTSNTKLYSFNYTELNGLAEHLQISVKDAIHIHGSLKAEGDIILGIETDNSIDEHYAFLYKTQNRYYQHTDILKDLRDMDEYIFFGHSLNGMDYAYFRSAFISLSGYNLNTPRLTIITKDVMSENAFKSFLRREGISLQGLFSNSIPTFILTDEVYSSNHSEIQKVKDLINRIKVA